MIFHMQSSLPYLLTALVGRKLSRSKVTFVYDIHDLNEFSMGKSKYEMLRFGCMFALEWVVFKCGVRLLTVSRGLANVYRLRYGRRPLVVRNIPEKVQLEGYSDLRRRVDGFVYFGLVDRIRLPEEFLARLESERVTLDIYGTVRERSASYRRKLEELENRGVLRFLGEYDPGDLRFLAKYRASVLPFEVCRINLRYSLPNKLFQALGYRVPCLISEGLIEAKRLFRQWPHAVVPLKSVVDLGAFLRAGPGPSVTEWAQIEAFLDRLRAEDGKCYTSALG